MNIGLPGDKLEKLLACIHSLYNKRCAIRLEVESLVGLFSHCAKVVRGGRTFARGVYDLCGLVKCPYHKIHLNQEFKLTCAGGINCPQHSMALQTYALTTRKHSYSDASQFGFPPFMRCTGWRAVGAQEKATLISAITQTNHLGTVWLALASSPTSMR